MASLKPNTIARNAPSPTPSNGSKRKRGEDSAVVYSQPQETGTGNHVYTQLTYSIDFLRQQERWCTFKEIMDYLNVKESEHQIRAGLQALFMHNTANNSIEYSPKTGLYRYRPKHDVRNAAQLKAYFQSQKCVRGLPVKELKDCWSTVLEDLKEMESKKQVLLKRNNKDNNIKTVYVNASLAY